MTLHALVPTLVFAVTYLAISGLPIPGLPRSRAAAALAGGVAMVLLGGLDPAGAWRAVDGDTLGLLLGMMLLAGALRLSGAFDLGTTFVSDRFAARPALLLWLVTFLGGVLSALLLNDAICLMLTPLVLDVCERARLKPVPYLLALATGANVGSTATLTGNPQNMIIGVRSGWPYLAFLARLGPIALAGLAVTAVLLGALYRGQLADGASTTAVPDRTPLPPPASADPAWRRRRPVALAIFAATTAGFAAGGNLALVALAGGAAVCLVSGRRAVELFREVDWTLLVFFAGLFVVVAGFDHTGLPRAVFEAALPTFGQTPGRQIASFSAFGVIASNLFSNVPFVLVAAPWMNGFAHPHAMWLVLAASSTLAGNLTIVGSMANMIVLETAGRRAHIGFWDYARAGVPITAATVVLSAAWLTWFGPAT